MWSRTRKLLSNDGAEQIVSSFDVTQHTIAFQVSNPRTSLVGEAVLKKVLRRLRVLAQVGKGRGSEKGRTARDLPTPFACVQPRSQCCDLREDNASKRPEFLFCTGVQGKNYIFEEDVNYKY